MRTRNCFSLLVVCACLVVLLLAYPANALSQSPDKLRFDYSAQGGYQGDYIVVLNSRYPGGSTLSTGFIGKLIETDIPAFEHGDHAAPDSNIYSSKQAGQDDPYTSMVGSAEDARWEIGSEWNFSLTGAGEVSPGGGLIAFKVLAAGTHCRIWTPLNPDYFPLDEIDPTYAQQAAKEFDAQYPYIVKNFGDFLDTRGDGLVNILFYNIHLPEVSGFTNYYDLYTQVTIDGMLHQSNAPPMIHIDTFGVAGIVRVDAQGQRSQDIARCFPVMAHEFQHLIFESKMYANPAYRAYWESEAEKGKFAGTIENNIWMTEFLSAAAGILRYPRMIRESYVPFWYHHRANYQDICDHFSRHEEVLANKHHMVQRGRGIFRWKGQKADYSLMAFLAQFAFGRGGEEIFSKAWELWDGKRDELGFEKPVEAVASALGYTDFGSFHRDFVLALLFNDEISEGGKYRLFVDLGDGDPGQTKEALSMLKPPLINGNEAKIERGGYVVFRPIGGVYVPPITAQKGLTYIGVTVNNLD